MFDSIFLLLALLAVKHWYIDFVNQTQEEIAHKGIYGHNDGIMHSLKHGLGTFLVMLLFIGDWPFAFTLGLIDMALHYHIDWIKMRWGTKDMQTPAFWTQLGLDQLAHTLTYILLVWLVV